MTTKQGPCKAGGKQKLSSWKALGVVPCIDRTLTLSASTEPLWKCRLPGPTQTNLSESFLWYRAWESVLLKAPWVMVISSQVWKPQDKNILMSRPCPWCKATKMPLDQEVPQTGWRCFRRKVREAQDCFPAWDYFIFFPVQVNTTAPNTRLKQNQTKPQKPLHFGTERPSETSSCVILGKSLNFSVSQFPLQRNGSMALTSIRWAEHGAWPQVGSPHPPEQLHLLSQGSADPPKENLPQKWAEEMTGLQESTSSLALSGPVPFRFHESHGRKKQASVTRMCFDTGLYSYSSWTYISLICFVIAFTLVGLTSVSSSKTEIKPHISYISINIQHSPDLQKC